MKPHPPSVCRASFLDYATLRLARHDEERLIGRARRKKYPLLIRAPVTFDRRDFSVSYHYTSAPTPATHAPCRGPARESRLAEAGTTFGCVRPCLQAPGGGGCLEPDDP